MISKELLSKVATASLLDLLRAFGCRPGLAGAAWSRATPNCCSTLAGPPEVGFADTTRGSTLAETPEPGFADNESAEFDAGIERDTCGKGSFFSPLGVTVEELSTTGG